jgi:hypothetical protein
MRLLVVMTLLLSSCIADSGDYMDDPVGTLQGTWIKITLTQEGMLGGSYVYRKDSVLQTYSSIGTYIHKDTTFYNCMTYVKSFPGRGTVRGYIHTGEDQAITSSEDYDDNNKLTVFFYRSSFEETTGPVDIRFESRDSLTVAEAGEVYGLKRR